MSDHRCPSCNSPLDTGYNCACGHLHRLQQAGSVHHQAAIAAQNAGLRGSELQYYGRGGQTFGSQSEWQHLGHAEYAKPRTEDSSDLVSGKVHRIIQQRANSLADECQRLADENRDLLAENARLRRSLERKKDR